MGQNNPSGTIAKEYPSNANGRAVINTAASFVGVVESPALTNTGTDVDRWNGYFSVNAVPWAGSFVSAMYREADVEDIGIGNNNIVTIWQRAVSNRRIAPSPFPGCIVVWGVFDGEGVMTSGLTAGIFVRWENVEIDWTFVTIEGDSPIGNPMTNNGVLIKVRSAWYPDPNDTTKQLRFVVPPSITIREATKSTHYPQT